MYLYGLRCFSSCLSLEKSRQLLKAQQNFLLFNAQENRNFELHVLGFGIGGVNCNNIYLFTYFCIFI